MRILLTGARGQLGRHLVKELKDAHELIQTDRADCDLTDPQAILAMLDRTNPELIINTAAMTAVDQAEDEPKLADQLNHQLPKSLADWASNRGTQLIHYSTDYVFGGTQTRPWKEDDPKAPESVYGTTKYLGEQAILQSAVAGFIVRTAWVYSALPGNFLTAILARAGKGENLKVVHDQVGSPTWAGSLAKATTTLIEGGHLPDRGVEVLHVANRGALSWHAFATKAVAHALRLGIIPKLVEVEAVGSEQWPQKAKRPSGSVLDVGRYETLTKTRLEDGEQALIACMSQWSQWQC